MNDRDKKRNANRRRKNRIVFYVDDDELTFIHAKMHKLGVSNREAYLRKMSIDGQYIRYDYSGFEVEMRKGNYLISNAANSLNQIAKRLHSTGNIYDEDVEDIKRQIEILRETQIEIMKLFMKETEEK